MMAQSIVVLLGMQASLRLIPTSSTFCHEGTSMAILPLPLIKEDQFSVNGKKCTLRAGEWEACPGTVWFR